MAQGYDAVLARIKEEREKRGHSQEAISKILDMTQSHYSKAERGDVCFTFEQMQKMNDVGMDVHYIISGKAINVLEHQNVMTEVSASEYYFFGRLFFVVVEQLLDKNKKASYQKIYDQSSLIRYILSNRKKNVWKLIRHYYDFSQADMAQMLGLNLRKYGRLENYERLPDSEILFLIYSIFNVPPQLFLGDDRGIIRAIGEVMEVLDEVDKVKIMKLWKTQIEILGTHNSIYST